ncbi:ABC transporter permease [Plantactinospora veratri]|uniref:ABC transporter permease n=1 Tax=Plantactinospora veratri TaxID=1436122 RepID=A0ABU7SJ12_9ACTN
MPRRAGSARPPQWRGALSTVGTPLVGIAGFVAAWWAAVVALDVAPYIVPGPPAVAAAILDEPGYLLRNAAVTLGEAMAGFALAIASAVLLGTVLAASRRLERALYPMLLTISSTPKPVFAPLLITIGGFGAGPKVVLVWLMCFFPIALATSTGLSATSAEFVELARSLNASRWTTFRKFRVPAALPHIFGGLRIALPLALIGATVAELFGATEGLGVVVQNAGTNAALAWAAIVVLAAMSINLFYALTATLRALAPWIRHTTA